LFFNLTTALLLGVGLEDKVGVGLGEFVGVNVGVVVLVGVRVGVCVGVGVGQLTEAVMFNFTTPFDGLV
jgi:hypothetical protein